MSPQQQRQNIRVRLTQAREELKDAREEIAKAGDAPSLIRANLRYRFARETFSQVLDEFTANVLRGKI